MLDDFFVRALLGGVGVALVAGPLGCFIVWRRMAYFGDTMAHAALLGVALAFLFDVNLLAAVFAVTVAGALVLIALQRRSNLSADSLLGILAHSTLSIGLVLFGFMSWLRVDLTAYLFGDILSVMPADLAAIWGGGALVLAILAWWWRPLLAATVSEEIAAAEGLDPDRSRLVFMVLLAAVIAMAMKVVGVLLVTALLIVPAATARRFASVPVGMAVGAALIGAVAVVLGLLGSMRFDTPSGPSVVVAALVLFLASLLRRPAGGRVPG